MKKIWLFLFAASGLCTRAELIVAPNDREALSGNGLTIAGFRSPNTYQNVYGAGNFSQPIEITAIAFRQNEASGGLSFDVVIPRVQIRISTYSGTFASFNQNQFAYDDNKGTDDMVAFDGSVHWTTTDLPGSGPNLFDLKILFSRPFVYDPSRGALLVNFSTGGNFTSGLAADSHGHNDPNIGWFGGNELGSLVTQFDVIPIPEPSTAALLIASIVTLVCLKTRPEHR
jgi:hypothetical protein